MVPFSIDRVSVHVIYIIDSCSMFIIIKLIGLLVITVVDNQCLTIAHPVIHKMVPFSIDRVSVHVFTPLILAGMFNILSEGLNRRGFSGTSRYIGDLERMVKWIFF